MIRVDRAELTRNEIIRVAANRFLNDGYTKTTVASMAKALNMSTGNMTFHFPTKEQHIRPRCPKALGSFSKPSPETTLLICPVPDEKI